MWHPKEALGRQLSANQHRKTADLKPAQLSIPGTGGIHLNRDWGLLGTEQGLREGLWGEDTMNTGYAENFPGSPRALLPSSLA